MVTPLGYGNPGCNSYYYIIIRRSISISGTRVHCTYLPSVLSSYCSPFFNVLINDFKEKCKDTLGEFMNKTVCDQLEHLLKTLDKSLADKPGMVHS